jgi:sporulation protein YtfJ
MKTTMDSIKEMVDVNTIVGDAVETVDGSVIIPISKVCFGFAAGGTEYRSKVPSSKNEEEPSKLPFGGGSGAGVSVQPVAFLVVGNGQIKLLPVNYSSVIDRIVDLAPEVIENIEKSIKNIGKKNNNNDKYTYEESNKSSERTEE